MKTIWGSIMLAAAVSGCGTLIKAPVSQAELGRVHHVGVAAVFSDQFYGRRVGFTVFGNERFDADVPQWEVGKLAQARAVEALRQGNPALQVDPLQVPKIDAFRADKDLGWLAAAQRQGIDTVVLLRPGTSDNYPFFAPGVGIYARGKFTCVYTAYVVEVYDVAAHKQIAWEWGASPPCKLAAGDPGIEFKADARQYSDVEMEAMRKLVDAKFMQTLPEALAGLHLTPAKP